MVSTSNPGIGLSILEIYLFLLVFIYAFSVKYSCMDSFWYSHGTVPHGIGRLVPNRMLVMASRITASRNNGQIALASMDAKLNQY